MAGIIKERELMEGLDIKQRSALIRYLALKGIPFDLTPSGKVWTVQRALDEHIIVPQKTTSYDISNDWEIGHNPVKTKRG